MIAVHRAPIHKRLLWSTLATALSLYYLLLHLARLPLNLLSFSTSRIRPVQYLASLLITPPPFVWTPDLIQQYRQRIEQGQLCLHCGGIHVRSCPRIKRQAFSGGNLIEAEYWPDRDWPKTGIVWPDEIPDIAETTTTNNNEEIR